MTLQALLNDITEWQADAGALVRRRSALLARARKLRMTAAVKPLLAVPRAGEPEAAEAPSAYPGVESALKLKAVGDAAEVPDPLDVPAALRRK